jgi:hypothetical protein
LIITLFVIVMVSVVAYGLESSCQAKFETNLPVYPDASVVSQDSKFLQSRYAKYYTTASTDDVKNWYNKTIYVAISESLAKNGTRGNVWDGEWDIQPASQGGSTVTLSRSCR